MPYLLPATPPVPDFGPIIQRLGRAQSLDYITCIFRIQEKSDTMSRFPETLPSAIRSVRATRSSSGISKPLPPVIYKQRSGYYAVHYATADVEPVGAEFVMADDGGGAIAVFKGEAPSPHRTVQAEDAVDSSGDAPAEQVTPVYAADNSVAAVPTGQIFVRFSEGVDARDRAAELKSAGYITVKVLDFAPQGAWVRARSGSIADSLQQLQSLEGLEKLEQIEPQMLMQRSLR